mmetsp:Transcript_9667/g.17001  ORF Transcript_9667/g.17001 Transcript_9667/m.17001 type:complete len:237 (-) Transcript_9667:123-833(-)
MQCLLRPRWQASSLAAVSKGVLSQRLSTSAAKYGRRAASLQVRHADEANLLHVGRELNGEQTLGGVLRGWQKSQQPSQKMVLLTRSPWAARSLSTKVPEERSATEKQPTPGVGVEQKKESEMEATAKPQLSKIKLLIQQYGAVGMGVYGMVYVSTLGGIYFLADQDIIVAADAIAMLKSTGLDHYVDMSGVNKKMGDFALAWILTKFTEPLRLVVSVSITPMVARALGRAPPLDSP